MTVETTDPVRTAHFAWLNQKPRPPVGERQEVNEAVYRYFEDLMTPCLWTETSFYMAEFDDDEVTRKYTREGELYFCEFAEYPGGQESRDEELWPEHLAGGLAG
jgi:hypothetical protein